MELGHKGLTKDEMVTGWVKSRVASTAATQNDVANGAAAAAAGGGGGRHQSRAGGGHAS